VWHYREGEEVTKLRFFVYLGYVEGIDHRGLLARTTEDGAFGCWTYRFEGHPLCSRDLLDSVCELSFLDRHLDLAGSVGVRVLDIGAGYGRLAHRSIESFPGITDYCCVDAVPHSTFLSEYYLEARGVAPPGRVVALPDVASLSPRSFDLALNVHSFSECTFEAIEWWLEQLARLEVPGLFIVPNEADGFLSLEVDGTRLDYLPVIERAGYRLTADEPAILDANARSLLDVHDRHCLFSRG
jgi:SAM-dependent methyltransferase